MKGEFYTLEKLLVVDTTTKEQQGMLLLEAYAAEPLAIPFAAFASVIASRSAEIKRSMSPRDFSTTDMPMCLEKTE